MTIGVLQLELSVTDAMSLKDKRRVVKSIVDRIAHGHNVSIAEVGALDQHRRAILGITMVTDDLSIADVFVTIMGTPGQQTAALNALKHSAGMMRTKLTKSLTLRVAPFIKFHMDEDLKKELEVLDLLRKVAEENAELDRKRA